MLAAPPPPPVPAPVVVGRSVQGRPIAVRRIGNPSAARTALVIGAIHGDEGAGRAIVRALADAGTAPAGSAVWLVSTVNPDGAARRTRTNARGVDLNRNFPRAWRASAPGGGDYGGPAAAVGARDAHRAPADPAHPPARDDLVSPALGTGARAARDPRRCSAATPRCPGWS